MTDSRVVVAVDDDSAHQLADVVDRLRAAGMAVEQVLEPIGTVTGSAAPEALPALADVAGVLSVEPDRGHQLPPPEHGVQ
jgi:hypothetical protein